MKGLNFNTMYDWPKGVKAVVIGVLFLIAFYAGYHWDITSLQVNLQDSIQQENDLKQQFEMIVTKKEKLQIELVQLPALKLMLANWEKQLPLEADLPEFMNSVLKLGASKHIFFGAFDPGEPVKENPFWHVPLKMLIVGNYDQVSLFLSQLANMPWIISLGNLVFSDENKNDVIGTKLAAMANQANMLTAEIDMNIYYIPAHPEQVVEKPKGKNENAKKTP